MVNAVLIQPLPYPDAERIVSVRQTAPGLGMDRIDQSDTSYLLYREHIKVLEELGIYAITPVTLTGGEEPERVESTRMTPSVFGVLQMPPALGRACRALQCAAALVRIRHPRDRPPGRRQRIAPHRPGAATER